MPLSFPNPCRQRLWRFARREEGSVVVLSLFVFVAMLLVGSIAVDVQRHETARLRMQGAADRAVLAAASLRTEPGQATPQQIVEAYFAAEGLSAQLGGRVTIEETADAGRSVTVVPAASMRTSFMNMIGVPDLPLVTPSQAREFDGRRTRIELVMVLDISGSMNGQGKIGAMRNAAVELVDLMLADAEAGDVAITLVPYDDWVLPPPGLFDRFTNQTGSGACADWTAWNRIDQSMTSAIRRRPCNTDQWAMVRPYQHDADTLRAALRNLRARGTTSIDLGVRVGALFFDPSMRPALDDMIDTGLVSTSFSGRPHDWGGDEAYRAMILLTDGENCCGSRGSRSVQDDNTLSVCRELRAQGIVVFAVAFQAPAGGTRLMQGCASSPGHFFNANISGIMAAFQAIGANIQAQALRLTQ